MSYYNARQSRFSQAFCHCRTSTSIKCSCGITHFTTARGHGDYEIGEIDGLRAKADADPQRYFEECVFDHFDWGYVNGRIVVASCICSEAERVAAFIEMHEEQITDYITLLIEERQKEAGFQRSYDDRTLQSLSRGKNGTGN